MLPLLGLAATGMVWVAPRYIPSGSGGVYFPPQPVSNQRARRKALMVFLQRAEIVARAAVQRSFDADILMTDVIVTVVGDYQGIAVSHSPPP